MEELELDLAAAAVVLHPLWLRDHCRCPQCVTPSSGQRIHAPGGWLAPERRAAWVIDSHEHVAAEGLALTWADGHRSFYAEAWLARFGPRRREPPREPPKRTQPAPAPRASRRVGGQREGLPSPEPWRAPVRHTLTRHGLEAVCADDASLTELLAELARRGAVIVEGCGTSEGRVSALAARLAGHVRETLYGRSWRVEAQPRALNVAYTDVALGFHQDLLYYENPPGIQLLHCLRFNEEVSGGLSTLGDGLALAEGLRVRDPQAHARLRALKLPYHYAVDGHRMQYRRPMIEAEGAARAVNWAWPWLAPLPLWAGEVEPVYRALHTWHELCSRPDRSLRFRLRPGETLVFDNHRMLHGRTAFEQPGPDPGRVLEGCYADWDGVASRYRALSR